MSTNNSESNETSSSVGQISNIGNKQFTEKARRDRMNESFAKLKNILLKYDSKTLKLLHGSKKLEQVDVLEYTVFFIQRLCNINCTSGWLQQHRLPQKSTKTHEDVATSRTRKYLTDRKLQLEKLRRTRINDNLNKLKNILLAHDVDSNRYAFVKGLKLEKAEILELAVNFITKLLLHHVMPISPVIQPVPLGFMCNSGHHSSSADDLAGGPLVNSSVSSFGPIRAIVPIRQEESVPELHNNPLNEPNRNHRNNVGNNNENNDNPNQRIWRGWE